MSDTDIIEHCLIRILRSWIRWKRTHDPEAKAVACCEESRELFATLDNTLATIFDGKEIPK